MANLSAGELLGVSDAIRDLAGRIPQDSQECRTAAAWLLDAAKLVEREAGAEAVRELREGGDHRKAA